MRTIPTLEPITAGQAYSMTVIPQRLPVRRLIIGWLVLAVMMTANGIMRELALVPLMGQRFADIASAAVGITLILGVTHGIYSWHHEPLTTTNTGLSPRGTSLCWLGMTVAFEELFGHYVDGKSWTELAANYAIWRGRLWPLVLLMVVVAPFLWAQRPKRPLRPS